jgi:chaperonin cofactor prefoldin
MADKSDVVLEDDTVRIRSTGKSPVVDIEGGNNWDLSEGDGDVRIGKGDNRLAIGVSLGGAGEGTSRLRAKGGTEQLKLGAGDTDTVTVEPDAVSIDGGLNVDNSENTFQIGDGNVSALSTEDSKGWAFVDKLLVQDGVRQHLTPMEGEGGSWDLGASDTRWDTLYVDEVNKSSDRRLKTDIEEFDRGLDAVLALRPVSYARRGNGDETHLGLVGQEVADVLPEVVDIPEDEEDYLGVDYLGIVSVLVDAVQDQQAEKEALEDRVDQQQGTIESQQERIDDLERRLDALEGTV